MPHSARTSADQAAGAAIGDNDRVPMQSAIPLGPRRAVVPDVVGLPQSEAIDLVRTARLVLAVVELTDTNGIVVAQDPAAGRTVPFGDAMTIWLGGGNNQPDIGDREPREPSPGPRAGSAENELP